MMLIDLFAALPFYLSWLGADGSQGASGAPSVPPAQAGPLLAGFANAGPRHRRRYRALLGALLIILVLLLFASATAYFLERCAQPDKFGSIPDAAWWAVATLTTVGYGDIVPVTPLGKLLGVSDRRRRGRG